VRLARNFSASVVSLSVGAVLMTTTAASAATITVSDVMARRGGPIAQNFLDTHGDNVSVVTTRNGASCVASRPLAIAESIYRAPDGGVVDISDVIRSPASSIQAIGRPDAPVTFRIQLKYSPDPAEPITMEIDDRTLDLAGALEASSDSLLLTGDAAELLAEALHRGETPALRATSGATGRQIIDRLIAPDMAGLDACLVTLDELLDVEGLPQMDLAEAALPAPNRPDAGGLAAGAPSGIVPEEAVTLVVVEEARAEPALPVPVEGLRLEFVARPDPEARIAPSALEHCRMTDIPENVYLGRLTAVTGFFSQTQDVYVAFDGEGQLQRAYIPGIFDSDLSVGASRARVSLAADSNLPDQPNTVRGCLGDALLEAPVCVFSEEGEDRYTLAECGVLGMSESREDLLSSLQEVTVPGLDGSDPILVGITPGGGGNGGSGGGFTFSGGGGGGTGGGGGGGPDLPEVEPFFPDPDDDDPDPPGGGGGGGGGEIPPVPLPAGLWLMLAALAGLSGLAARARRRRLHA
jgi:uncharacterized membrane protein YgcG